jgi:hypothetical protein
MTSTAASTHVCQPCWPNGFLLLSLTIGRIPEREGGREYSLSVVAQLKYVVVDVAKFLVKDLAWVETSQEDRLNLITLEYDYGL